MEKQQRKAAVPRPPPSLSLSEFQSRLPTASLRATDWSVGCTVAPLRCSRRGQSKPRGSRSQHTATKSAFKSVINENFSIIINKYILNKECFCTTLCVMCTVIHFETCIQFNMAEAASFYICTSAYLLLAQWDCVVLCSD